MRRWLWISAALARCNCSSGSIQPVHEASANAGTFVVVP